MALILLRTVNKI